MAAQDDDNIQVNNVQEAVNDESNVVVASGKDQLEEKEQEEADEDMKAAGERELAEGMFLVEEVRAKRTYKGQMQYFVKWQNWDDSHCTWEPASHLEGCMDYVREYEERAKQKKRKRKRGSGGRTPARKRKTMDPAVTLSESGHESGIDEGNTAVEGGGASDGIKSPETSMDTHVVTTFVNEKEPDVADDIFPKASTENQPDAEETKTSSVLVMLDGSQDTKMKEAVIEAESVVSEPAASAAETKDQDQDKEKEASRENEKRPANEPDASSSRPRKRKPAVVRRVSQGPETQPHVLEETVSRGIGLKTPQAAAAGSTLQDYSVIYPGASITRKAFSSPERAVQRASSSSQVPFVKILKPISYSNSTKNDRQEVTVLFSVLRSDEKEVVVDNKYLRQQYPQLLIDFYEQHLRYTSK